MGSIIALSGMDGTGKTTISLELMKKFVKFGVPTMYVHGFSNPLLSRIPVLSMLFKMDRMKVLSKPHPCKVEKSFLYRVVLCTWHFIVFMELLLYFTYIQLNNRKHIIIFDRFWYDRYAYALSRSDDFILLRLIYANLFRIIKTEIFLLLGSAALFKLDAEYAAYLYKIATNSPLDYLVLAVGAFFFGAHLVRTSKGQ